MLPIGVTFTRALPFFVTTIVWPDSLTSSISVKSWSLNSSAAISRILQLMSCPFCCPIMGSQTHQLQPLDLLFQELAGDPAEALLSVGHEEGVQGHAGDGESAQGLSTG